MPVRRRLRRITLWSCVALSALFVMYFGLYMRIVAPVRMVHWSPDATPFRLVHSPRYSVPWPVPAQYNQPWLQSKLESVFSPAHALDRRLRPDVWPGDRPIVGLGGAGGRVTIDQSTFLSDQFEISFGRRESE